MSMISAQCDELRDVADDLDRVTNGIRSGVPASTWHGMTYVFDSAAKSLRQAADTIWELRCKLADVVDQSEEIERLRRENAELRELVSEMFREIELACFNPMVERQGKRVVYYKEDPSWRVKIRKRMRELGIEVGNA